MADLMTSTWEYSSLESQYKNFRVPAVSFTVGGTDLIKKGVSLKSVEAVLNLEGASSVNVVFNGGYDVKNGSFNSTLKSAAVLGKTVELSLGYQSSLKTIFKGYLSNVRITASADEGYLMEFVALDARRLMMTDNNHAREYKIKNYSDAVAEVLKRYAKLCSAKVDATSENLKNGLLWQRGSDYDFITKELIGSGRTDREFFVSVDKVYFRKPRSVSSPVITLKPGGGLISVVRDAEYINRTIEILGFDPASGKSVSGKSAAKTKENMSDPVGGAGEWYISDPACSSASQAGNWAKALADSALTKCQKAEISCVGLPEIIPGRFIKIERVDSLVNKKYYITRVTHRCSEAGFFTDIETEGWE